MNICSKCKILKEDNMFATYWHSTQNKMRTRRICISCFNLQKAEYRKMVKEKKIVQPEVPELQPEPIIDYSLDPNYKQCIKCKEYRTRDKFYKFGTDSRFNTCKICIKKKDDAERELELIENGGSMKIPPKPNQYRDKYQKQLVFEFLPMIGWIFNEEKGIWYKPGLKDENGNFLNLNGKKRRNLTGREISDIYKMYEQGYKEKEISKKLAIDYQSVYRWILKYEKDRATS